MYHKPHKIKFGQCHTIMAVSTIQNDPFQSITCTKGINVGDFTFECFRAGRVVVLSYYFTVTGGIVKDSVIATLSMDSTFVRTFFNGSIIRLQGGEKTVRAERDLTPSNSGFGQIIGIVN